MNRKNLFFFSFMLIPAAFLAVLVVLTARDIYATRMIDPKKVYQSVQEHLTHREVFSFPLPDEIYVQDGSRKSVFVFGSSDVIVSDGVVFPARLEQQHPELRVINLGVMGIDSFLTKRRVSDALSAARPDLIILYMGHNDYNEAYHGVILPAYFEKFDSLLWLTYLFSTEKPALADASDRYYWFMRRHSPRIYEAFQGLGLIDIHSDDYLPVNRLILDYFIGNYDAILKLAAAQGIPVIAITPVGNLRAEPYGDYRTTTALYRKGLVEGNYEQSLAYLKKARDTEILTYDVRAKSPVVEYLRKINRPGVRVLDLEKILERMHFDFGHSDFLDYVHFNNRTHRLVAEIIYDFLRENHLAGKGNKAGHKGTTARDGDRRPPD